MSNKITKKDRFISFVGSLLMIYAMGAGAVWYSKNYDPQIYEQALKDSEGGYIGMIKRAFQ